MINLLSPTDKKELHAARRNTIWSRYTFLTIALLIAVNIILALTIFFIKNQATVYETRIAQNQAQSDQRYSTTRIKTTEFKKNLATAKSVLASETKYSNVIVDIARSIPSGCVLSSLILNAQSFGTVQSLSFNCKTTPDIIRLKTTLEKNTQLFDKVNIVSTQAAGAFVPGPYRVSVNMSLILKQPLPAVNTKAVQ